MYNREAKSVVAFTYGVALHDVEYMYAYICIASCAAIGYGPVLAAFPSRATITSHLTVGANVRCTVDWPDDRWCRVPDPTNTSNSNSKHIYEDRRCPSLPYIVSVAPLVSMKKVHVQRERPENQVPKTDVLQTTKEYLDAARTNACSGDTRSRHT